MTDHPPMWTRENLIDWAKREATSLRDQSKSNDDWYGKRALKLEMLAELANELLPETYASDGPRAIAIQQRRICKEAQNMMSDELAMNIAAAQFEKAKSAIIATPNVDTEKALYLADAALTHARYVWLNTRQNLIGELAYFSEED